MSKTDQHLPTDSDCKNSKLTIRFNNLPAKENTRVSFTIIEKSRIKISNLSIFVI